MRRAVVLLGTALLGNGTFAVDLGVTLETRFQVDNRFNTSPRVLGEVWGDAELSSRRHDWRAHFSWAGRLSSLSDASGGKLYQGFVEKRWGFLNGALRLGRFQRTDPAGFYLLDGGQLDHRLGGWHVQWYGGRPLRADHVRSVEGDSVYGVSVDHHQILDRRWGSWRWEGYHFTAAYQAFRDRRLSRRLQGTYATQGTWGGGRGRAWEAALAATYRFDRKAFENVWFNGFVDLTRTLRFRTNYEYYRPRTPFPTFRERFVSAYALGEQTLFRAELHHRPFEALHYFLGGQRATKADGFDGYGIRAGGDYRIGDTRMAVTYDFLEIGDDRAHSGYAQVRHAFDSRLEAWLNAAVRREEKLLYGVNWVRGGEGGFRYLFSRSWVLITSLSYIANSRRRDDYVGAVRLIYYFDRFRPKGKACAWLC